MKRVIASSLVFLLSACSTNKDGSLPEVVRVSRTTPYHIVKDGETVGSIAKKYDMTRADLIRMNELKAPYHLYNGQRIIVSKKKKDESAENVVVVENKLEQTPVKEPELLVENSSENVTIDDIPQEEQPVVEREVVEEEVSEYDWPIASGKNKFEKSPEGGLIFKVSAGTPVRAFADGEVVFAAVLTGEAKAYGMTVILKHSKNSKMSVYSHLQEANVSVKQRVSKGDIIGKVGKTGALAKEPQLYFEVRSTTQSGKKKEDPEIFLPK